VAIFGGLGILWLRPYAARLFLPPYMVQNWSDILAKSGWSAYRFLVRQKCVLIVEFAKDASTKATAAYSALEGADFVSRRFSKMTSFAFIFGCVPLWVATGAVPVARQIHGDYGDWWNVGLQHHRRNFLVPGVFYLVEKFSGAAKTTLQAVCPQRLSGAGD